MALPGKNSRVFGGDRICGVVAADTAVEMLRQILAGLPHTRSFELRLDWLRSQEEANLLLSELWEMRAPLTFIATCRRREAGGKFTLSKLGPAARKDLSRFETENPGGTSRGFRIAGAQIALLAMAGASRCRWCDVEWETTRDLPRGLLRIALSKSKLLVSLHDFRRTPPNLKRLLRRLELTGANAVKIATECRSIADSVRVLHLARGRRNVIAVPMGEAGLPARVLALREGSALAYAAVGPATAPGQLSLEEMKTLYRADRLDRRTRVYGVIGDPVGHSLSPLLHNTGFTLRRINAVYLPFLVRELRDFLAIVQPLGVAGFSVTLPYKQRILAHLDECDPLAASIGAVNTVVRRGSKLCGYNTDYVGVLRALERRLTLRGSRILLFGAGGAARAVAFALARADAEVIVCARKLEQARHLARAAGGEAILRRHLQTTRFDAIVNATPVGMHPRTGASPLTSSELRCRLVFDLVYRPMRTRLLELAARRGIETVSGAEMFVAQGIAQWEMWTEQRAPEAAMRRAVLAALAREERAGARGKP